MRIAVLSDVHGNREAFLAVLERLEGLGSDRILFLGDVVGYNPDPNFCVERLFGLDAQMVRGNHDKAMWREEDLDAFNAAARRAAEWTREALSAANLERVKSMPSGPLAAGHRLVACHGSPMDEDLYIFHPRAASASFYFLEERYPDAWICFFGHTHLPVVIEEGGRVQLPHGGPVALLPEGRYLINPGSVGQPRDGDPQASFGVLDTEELRFEHYRVAYPVEVTQKKILAAGLPAFLADRLARGG